MILLDTQILLWALLLKMRKRPVNLSITHKYLHVISPA